MTTARDPFLSIDNVPIYFDEDWATGIGGGLWSTGYAMAKYLQLHVGEVRENLQRMTTSDRLSFIELGSGNGFLSLCFMAVAGRREQLVDEYIVTDTQDHLELIRQTLDANPQITNGLKSRVVEHKWGEFDKDDEVCDRTFDLIVGSDVAYHPSLYDPLIASLKRLSHAKTVILMGCTLKDTDETFFHKLRQARFHYTRLSDHLVPIEFRGTTFGLFLIVPHKE